jgi:adenine-specific DNA-methyltransferase
MNNFLNSDYRRETWIDFLQKQFLPDDFRLRREQIDLDFKSTYIRPQAHWIGDCDSLGDLAIIEVYHKSENDPRIGVSRDAFRLMAEHGLSKALFFFVSDNSNNYRFSLITLDLKLAGTDVKYQFSNPKRFSFFLGEEAKIHTPQEFLFKKGRIKDFEDLQSRFSIEVVNKEFYHEIQRLFYKLVGGKVKQGTKELDFPPLLKLPSTNDHQAMQEFSVRLIGRLVFCWFLKKKKSDAGIPLIPENILSSVAIENNYYHNLIEPLFFELLNTQIDKRRDDFRSLVFDLIPFLNGGLFDPNLHEDYYHYSPMERTYKPSFNLVVPDEWLKEMITILETYNFTIDENTSIDIDLSVDPEMLGRIFENLLAEINPETGNTAQKATGSYYTPRPIVEYMVDESLIQYLLTKTDIQERAIRELLDYKITEAALNKDQKIAVIDALDDIKVLDPACGSGAFPMGILQKMLLILQKVDPKSIEWVIRKLDKIPNKLVRQALEDKLMSENWTYQHKMGIIENAIYGVDIQPIATEISKLRLFLTLIVDENIIDEKPNRNINQLPNLSFKFVTANSLIGLGDTPDLNDWTNKQAYDECVSEMEIVREHYFHEYDKTRKTQLENKIKDIQKKLYKIVIDHQIQSGYFNHLIDWNPFEDKTSGWFDPSWMFGIDNGFNIVIGNPPYIKEYTDRHAFDGLRNSPYYKGKMDVWYLFACIGMDFTKANNGILTFIATNNWVTSFGASKLRDKIINYSKIIELNDFGNYKIFENADIQTMIMILKNDQSQNEYRFSYSKIIAELPTQEDVEQVLQKQQTINNYILHPILNRVKQSGRYLVFAPEKYESVLEKILSCSNFQLLVSEIRQGIVAPQDFLNQDGFDKLNNDNLTIGDGIFTLTTKEFTNIEWNSNELDIIKPFYTSKQIKKYWTNNINELWVIYTSSDFNSKNLNKKIPAIKISDYPNIKSHLDQYERIITSVNKPYGLHRSRDMNLFEGEKILALRKCQKEPIFSYSNFPCYVSQSYNIIKTDRVNYKYLLAILNSKLVKFWLKFKGKMQGNNYQIDIEPMLSIPIRLIHNIDPIIILVNMILFCKEKEMNLELEPYYAEYFEQVIDGIVFEIYFEKVMKSTGREILKHLGTMRYLTEEQSDEEKIKIIKSEYKCLYNHDHPVKYAVETINSIDDIRMIKESLK